MPAHALCNPAFLKKKGSKSCLAGSGWPDKTAASVTVCAHAPAFLEEVEHQCRTFKTLLPSPWRAALAIVSQTPTLLHPTTRDAEQHCRQLNRTEPAALRASRRQTLTESLMHFFQPPSWCFESFDLKSVCFTLRVHKLQHPNNVEDSGDKP